jgi:hypothetical protein
LFFMGIPKNQIFVVFFRKSLEGLAAPKWWVIIQQSCPTIAVTSHNSSNIPPPIAVTFYHQ